MHSKFYIARQPIMFLNMYFGSSCGNMDRERYWAILIIQLQRICQEQVEKNVATLHTLFCGALVREKPKVVFGEGFRKSDFQGRNIFTALLRCRLWGSYILWGIETRKVLESCICINALAFVVNLIRIPYPLYPSISSPQIVLFFYLQIASSKTSTKNNSKYYIWLLLLELSPLP